MDHLDKFLNYGVMMRSLNHLPLEILAISNAEKKKKDCNLEIVCIWSQSKKKTRDSNVRAGSNGTLNKSSKSEKRFHVSDFGLKILG